MTTYFWTDIFVFIICIILQFKQVFFFSPSDFSHLMFWREYLCVHSYCICQLLRIILVDFFSLFYTFQQI